MNEILIITNHVNDTHVINFAYQFAHRNKKDLVVAQLNKRKQVPLPSYELAAGHKGPSQAERKFTTRWDTPQQHDKGSHAAKMETIDAAHFTENELVAYARQLNCALIIADPGNCRLNLQLVLDKVSCPVMLLPESFTATQINRIVYLTDLRYCEQPVIGHLSYFRGSSLLLAHICQAGLPDLDRDYGQQLFKDTVGYYNKAVELFFSHIKESNFQKVIDTLTNTMRADMLVCLNRRFHFQQFFGDRLPKRLPGYISVPLLVFPC